MSYNVEKLVPARSPGKFEGGLRVDELVYLLTLDGGPDEQTGDAQSTGWFGLLKGGGLEEAVDPRGEPFRPNADEVAYLTEQAGAIVFENSQGFVDVFAFEDAAELEKTWREIVATEEGL
jgi:hypothetical protein